MYKSTLTILSACLFSCCALHADTAPAASVSIENSDAAQTTALLIKAIREGDQAALKALLDAGASVNSCDTSKRTLLTWAVALNQKEMVQMLIELGANVDNQESFYSALAIATKTRNLEIVQLLLQSTADIDALQVRSEHLFCNSRSTVLMTACGDMFFEYPALVQALIKAGADVNVQDEKGNTALRYAAGAGNYESVRILLESGADVNAKNSEGRTALMSAATFKFNLAMVQLLLDFKADVNAQNDDGYTALMQAADWGNTKVVKLLLDAGADVNMRTKAKRLTALDLARKGGYKEVMQMLIDAGADDSWGREMTKWLIG